MSVEACICRWDYTDHQTDLARSVQVYEYTAAVLSHAGGGAVRTLASPVLHCLLLELYSECSASGKVSAQQPPSGKKRKRQKAQQQQDDLAALAKAAPAPEAHQVSCLQTFEAQLSA